jgi:hypothetical protein
MRDPSELEAEYASTQAPKRAPTPKVEEDTGRDPSKMREDLDAKHIQKEEERESGGSDPRTKREYTFHFDYTDPETKQRHSAIFTNQILDLDLRMRATTLESQLLGGVNYDSVEPIMGATAKAIAHMTFSLKAKQQQSPAGWADNFLKLISTNPVTALFEEVLGHERTFRGLGATPETSEAES